LSSTTDLARRLEELGADIHGPLEEVAVPMYVLDRDGAIVWLNDAGRELIPGAIGRRFDDVLAPELVEPARRKYALRMSGRAAFVDHETVLKGPSGERRDVEISSAPLRKDHRIVGVFGVLRPGRRIVPARPEPELAHKLTPRQHETLRLLGAGLTTRQMAERMGVSTETVRNHVRGVLGQLEAQSRLEAVLRAHRVGLLGWGDVDD
jgi:PAS domain S-box-containing protein